MTDAPILRMADILAVTKLCRGSIYKAMKAGTFPPSVKLTQRAIGWRRGDVDKWLADPAGYRSAGTQ
jgi:prophage regulatory protein